MGATDAEGPDRGDPGDDAPLHWSSASNDDPSNERSTEDDMWRRPSPDSPATPSSYSAPDASPPSSETPSYGAPSYGSEPPSSTETSPYENLFAGPQPPEPPEPPHRDSHRRNLRIGAGLAALVLIAGVIGGLIAHALDGNNSGVKVTSAPVASIPAGSTRPTEQLARVAAAVQPSVVSITVTGSSGSDEGSGVVLRSDGTVLTNNHVVEAAASGGSISVKFADGRTAAAKILGRDPTVDLAVVKANNISGVTPATLGTTKTVHVGDTVLAVGSPLGLEGSVTSGIVSALHRTVSLGSADPSQSSTGASVGDAVQTDAAINPGNSGGPLADLGGRVIGINTAIASVGGSSGGQSGNIGVGFAIPIDEAQSVANQLIQGQTPKHAVLGVQVQDDPDGGALIVSVTKGGPADKAGLRAGDVVTQVDSTSVADATSLTAVIRSHQPGDKVTVHYKRGGTQHTASVVLGSAS
jgi:putative serine protease PepD